MTYTTQQLQVMSDFEVNNALTLKIAGKDWIDNADFTDCGENGSFYALCNAVGDPFFIDVLDYCNNPNDIMPLAFERRIGVSTYLKSDDWMAFMCDNSGKSLIDKNPLRAIACLILMMED